MSHQIVSGSCHSTNKKIGDFATLRRLSPHEEELDGGRCMLWSFILRSAQQEEALHHI
ncbi:unnamed protein product [Spirodela intermedia]|uniref:Uncharacterized protein n=1 Tax=Spirodela intermedia TaxID=51605 RepID=A0ABN7E9Z8_SPIIN|nr:unnamed protein product [Spirodela intermedia]